MKLAAMKSFMEFFPKKRQLCHIATTSLRSFVQNGDRLIHSDSETTNFAWRLSRNLSQAKQIGPLVGDVCPSHLYSVCAVKAPEYEVICHSAMVIELQPKVVIAEGGYDVEGVREISLESFLMREARNGHKVYEFSPEVLDSLGL